MPIQPMQFDQINFQQANPFLSGLDFAQKYGQREQMFPEELRRAQLANAIAAVQAKYAGPQAAMDLSYKQAQIPYVNAQTGKLNKDIQWYDRNSSAAIAQQLAQVGLTNKETQWYDRKAQSELDTNQIKNQMTNAQLPYAGLLSMKNLSPVGKSYAEPLVLGNMLPGADKNSIQDNYDLYRQKVTTDQDTRKRNLYSTNIEKTISNINPDDLFQYSGAGGALSKKFEEAAAPFGKQTKNYESYLKSKQAAQLLATQVRQFYGDSIKPEMLQRLEALTNPEAAGIDSKTAKILFKQTQNILSQEMGTYRDALRTRKTYESQGAGSSSAGDPLGIR